MIEVKKKGSNFLVFFTGKTTQFNEYINKVMSVKEKQYDFEDKCWMFDEASIDKVYKLFDKPKPPTAIPTKTTTVVTGYESMGSTMKLKPYDYQKEAIKFSLDTSESLIVYPCGAGKTCIGIGAYVELKRAGAIKGPGMIIVKASLKMQWNKEVEKFSDLTSVVIKTPPDISFNIREKIKRRERKLKTKKFVDLPPTHPDVKEVKKEITALKKEAIKVFEDQFKGYDLFIMNYETLLDTDVRAMLRKAKVEFSMADEIHYIKNKDSKRSKALSEFSDLPYKIGATATPVGKSPEDLFGIFRFINPKIFPNWKSFAASYIKYAGYGKVAGFKNLDKLRDKIAPSIIVKSKEDISDQLPSLLVMQRYCELEPAQKEVHKQLMAELDELGEQEYAIRSRLKSEHEARSNPELMKIEGQILARQTFAQQLANSEELFLLSDSEQVKKYATGAKSNKMEVLTDLVEEILSSGEKVAIYSRFKKMQDVIIKRFNKEFPDAKIAQIHGALNDKERYEQAYTKFRDQDDYKILLSSDAGAEGLNLSKCKYLIEMEPAISYGIQTQRQGRVERADSIHDNVFVYQIICNDSWDEVGLKIIEKKEGFDADLIRKAIIEE